ncbi:MAG: c-type cytochrome [Verrucomicrobiaceae bacterium]|nr:c-type cytochrome [Verrucomicrobiaceae bacterium]
MRGVFIGCLVLLCGFSEARSLAAGLRAGAAVVDITPRDLPVIVNGGFLSREVRIIVDRLHSRAIALSSKGETIVIAVVDNCMIPTGICDEAKRIAAERTGIAPEKILICATHTHNAPSVMDLCLGTDLDKKYAAFLPERIAESIVQAHAAMQPARAGWAVFDGSEYTKPRRWVLWPGNGTDPFGNRTVRANMHPGYQNPAGTGESGPTDPSFTLFSIISRDGTPLALLGNFSMHYFSGHAGISADYFGKYCNEMAERSGPGGSACVVALCQGTSGDVWRADYRGPRKQSEISIKKYVEALADLTEEAISGIEYHDDLPLKMEEVRMAIRRRVPDRQRLAWAREIAEKTPEGRPRNRPEVYAKQAIHLHGNPEANIVLQAIMAGDFCITAMPNEVYALTGLKLKALSPLSTTMNIELANGAEGYIPPAEQHALGGYTTWPSVTAGLEVGAEGKITETLVSMLERISGKERRVYRESRGAFAQAIERLRPLKEWPLGGLEPGVDFEPGVLCHLPGVVGAGFPDQHRSRSAHFAGGRVVTKAELGDEYSVSLWFWNGLRPEARPVTGYLFSRGEADDPAAPGDHVGIGGSAVASGRLIIFNGNQANELLEGKVALKKDHWYHLVFVRRGNAVEAFLNGKREVAGELRPTHLGSRDIFIGGRNDNFANFEGRLDEVAIFNRALDAVEVSALFERAGIQKALDSSPLSAAESLQKVHVPAGFKVELVAAEPLVMDPVAIDWAVDGSIWVAEMADYPSGGNGHSGRIVRLIDTDGDHQPDQRQAFMGSVKFPTGIMAWGKGVIVTAGGEILYAEDLDGDGDADLRETWFSGFMEGNQQLRVNGLRWGIDDWIYCASGGHHAGFGVDTVIKCVKTGKAVKLGARDFRFRSDGAFEPVAGPSQFGRVRDNDGNWFGVQNAHPLWHYVLEDRYLGRNPDVPAPDPRKMLRGSQPGVFAASKAQKRFHGFDHVGRYTSACGISIYRDNILFPLATGKVMAFTCEPFSNLVQRHVLTPHGVSFSAARAADGKHDFFASEDRWCRPVMSRTAPDGSLWVVDMYRYMIEHPQWLPPGGRKELEPHYYSGQGKGRIYRVTKAGAEHPWRRAASDSPNGIARDIAERESFRTGTQPKWDVLRIESAMKSDNPGWRRVGLQRSESLPVIPQGLIDAAKDPDAKVRLQAAFSLGEFEDKRAGTALVEIARRDGSDPYVAAAVLSSAVPHFKALASATGDLSEVLVIGLMKMGRNDPSLAGTMTKSLLAGKEGAAKWRMLAEAPAGWRNHVTPLAMEAATDETKSEEERIAAVGLLGKEGVGLAAKLLGAEIPLPLQAAAISMLGRLGEANRLLDAWQWLGPAGRETAEGVLLAREVSVLQLLSALESGKMQPVELSASVRQRLLMSKSGLVQRRAKKLFQDVVTHDRLRVVNEFRPALSINGDIQRGRDHFIARCAACHQLGDLGRAVGPDLKTITNRSREDLLVSLLDPSRSVEPRYLGYTARLQGGESIYGMIVTETANSIVMNLMDGSERIIARPALKAISSTGKSAMPAGLEAGFGHADVADLLAFIKQQLRLQ